jgi:hypothetical protein
MATAPAIEQVPLPARQQWIVQRLYDDAVSGAVEL